MGDGDMVFRAFQGVNNSLRPPPPRSAGQLRCGATAVADYSFGEHHWWRCFFFIPLFLSNSGIEVRSGDFCVSFGMAPDPGRQGK